jgi:hypothetical protein
MNLDQLEVLKKECIAMRLNGPVLNHFVPEVIPYAVPATFVKEPSIGKYITLYILFRVRRGKRRGSENGTI